MKKVFIILVLISLALCNDEFLQEDPQQEAQKGLDIVYGFLQGSQIFSMEPHAMACYKKVLDGTISKDIVKIVDLFKSFEFDTRIFNTIMNLLGKGMGMYARITLLVKGCEGYGPEAERVFQALDAYFKRSDYPARAGQHFLMGFLDFSMKLDELMEVFETNNYKDQGRKVGDMLKFILYWDFHM